MKYRGILMPVASLPAEHGMGDFGERSYEFIDMLAEAGVNLWQILPLNPLGYGYSPYQPFSSFAGDARYINLRKLKDKNLLASIPKAEKNSVKIDYKKVEELKTAALHEAFSAFLPTQEYYSFIEQEWVFQYGVFISLKKRNNLVCWNEWPIAQQKVINELKRCAREKDRENKCRQVLANLCDFEGFLLDELLKDIQYEMFTQYLFLEQWQELKAYANKKNISILGDVPFYVGVDSLDVWANQEVFLLDEDAKPTFIAGVPPDYFSTTGQRWGNPIYDWEYLKKTGFDFWIKRLAYNGHLFDLTRIDHFRAFDTYWKIPASCPTAIEGEWVEAPGYAFFDQFFDELKDIQIVVEDLGDLRPQVHQLRDHYQFMGMKVLQFTYDPLENNNDFEDRENMILYTGTHDNQTIMGWYKSKDQQFCQSLRNDLRDKGYVGGDIAWRFVQFALDSIASIVVIAMQDILGMGDEARINTPGTLGSPNWEWKLRDYRKLKGKLNALKELLSK